MGARFSGWHMYMQSISLTSGGKTEGGKNDKRMRADERRDVLLNSVKKHPWPPGPGLNPHPLPPPNPPLCVTFAVAAPEASSDRWIRLSSRSVRLQDEGGLFVLFLQAQVVNVLF